MKACYNCGHFGTSHRGAGGDPEQGICYADRRGTLCGCPTYRPKGQALAGDRVTLVWNGYRGVPKSLAHEGATVVRVLRSGKLEVAPDTEVGTRIIRPSQVKL